MMAKVTLHDRMRGFIFIPNSIFLPITKWFVRVFHCRCDKSRKSVGYNMKSLQMKLKTEPVVQDLILSLLCKATTHSAPLCFIISVFLSCITWVCWILDLWGFLPLQKSAFQWKTLMNKQNVCLRPGSTNINWRKSLLQMTKWYFVANRRALEYLLCASGASKCK